jgi:hypothetical protein
MKQTKEPTTKSKKMNEAQLLDLLRKVLPKATDDAKLASKIYDAIESELKQTVRVNAFEKFCAKVELPDLKPATLMEVKRQFTDSFGEGNVKLKADPEEESAVVEISVPEGTLKSRIKVGAVAEEESDEQEITLKFISFPVCLPADPELIWTFARRENMTTEEAGIMLAKVQEDFWASKSGQKLLRDRVERTFPEFVSRVPSKALTEVGLKRHYKEPETVKPFKAVAPQKKKG